MYFSPPLEHAISASCSLKMKLNEYWAVECGMYQHKEPPYVSMWKESPNNYLPHIFVLMRLET